MDVVTLGETMVLFEPLQDGGRMQYSESFRKTIGGAESNVAIGLSKLGHRATWISKLGEDPFGRYVYSYLKGEGVNVDHVTFTKDKHTGVYFKETGGFNQTNIYYYRNESAASCMRPEDISEDVIAQAKYLHITGITSALSESCHQTIMHAIDIAKKSNVQIIFDPNIRQSLWSEEKYIPTLKEILKHATYFLPGKDELALLYPGMKNEEMIKEILDSGVEVIVMKNGKEGASYHTKDEDKTVSGYPNDAVRDPVGAGDAFAAGFMSGLLDHLPLEEAVRRGNLIGSMVTMIQGDCEGLPYRQEMNAFLNQTNDVKR